MKKYIALFFFLCISNQIYAIDNTIFLWPNGHSENPIIQEADEFLENRIQDQNEFGFNRSYSFVSKPTMTLHLAQENNNSGVAVVVFPGGGYSRIVIDKEGHDIARILNASGISAFVVKYSTYPKNFRQLSTKQQAKIKATVLRDAQRAVRIVRKNAVEWKINPDKVGAMGFSAGGNLCYRLATNYDLGGDAGKSPIEQQSCKVNFAAPIYPDLRESAGDVNSESPPMFIVVAHDDKITPAEGSIDLYVALRKNKVPAELHIFSKGVPNIL